MGLPWEELLLTGVILTGDKIIASALTKPHFAFQENNLWEEFGPAAFSMRVRSEGMYNIGPTLSPTNAFILQGLETLGMRMERHMPTWRN